MGRFIIDHQDGLGLNDKLTITCDERGNGGTSHKYEVTHSNRIVPVARIQFQDGPREESGSIPGVTDEAILAILIDRFQGFQAGPYPSKSNARVLSCLQECMALQRDRAIQRSEQGVLGKNAPHVEQEF